MSGIVVLLSNNALLLADEVRVGGKVYAQTDIRSFDGEFLVFGNSDETIQAKRLPEIDAIFTTQLKELVSFNQAERMFEERRYEEAQKLYLASLERARGYWEHLIRARHIQACDRAGNLDVAVEYFIRLARLLPEKASAFAPRHIKESTSEVRRKALQILTRSLAETNEQGAYWELESLRLNLLEYTNDTEASKAAGDIYERLRRRKENAAPQHRLAMMAIRMEIKHQQYEIALDHVNETLADATEQHLPELLYLKGKCLFETALSQEDYIRAGLAFMRVVIHFPTSELSAECMYYAALVHEKLNRPTKARSLLLGSKEQSGMDEELSNKIDEALNRLSAPSQ